MPVRIIYLLIKEVIFSWDMKLNSRKNKNNGKIV